MVREVIYSIVLRDFFCVHCVWVCSIIHVHILLRFPCVPISKKCDRKNLSIYRPSANLPILSKIIEKLIYTRFNNFFSKFNVFNPNQYGFQSGKSTDHAIIRLLDSPYDCINQNKFAIAAFVDYKKAFVTINYEILIKKNWNS